MPARSLDTATISFGLVSIPIKIYTTAAPQEEVHFHFVHATCGTQLKQQYVCPKDGEIVEREDIARGFTVSKRKTVVLSKEEVKALDTPASDELALDEFVPAAAVDPIYVDKTYYLGPDKGGERAYRLLGKAMERAKLVGIGTYAARGNQYVVMIRPFEDGLAMHQLRYPDEIKPWSEVPVPAAVKVKDSELELAEQIIDKLARKTFDPSKYHDEEKDRVQKLVASKLKGQPIEEPEVEKPAVVKDLMAALKASLEGKAGKAAHGKANGKAANGKAAAPRRTAKALAAAHGKARTSTRRAASHAPARASATTRTRRKHA